MKHYLITAASIGILGACILGASSCAKQNGPLSPSVNLLGSAPSSKRCPTISSFSNSMGSTLAVSQTVQVQFNQSIDPATLNSGTVLMFRQTDSGVGETNYPYFALSYVAGTRTLLIAPDPGFNSGFWQDNSVFRIAITPGVKGTNGYQLDGNRNSVAEDQAFDTCLSSFKTGSPAAPGYVNIVSALGDVGVVQALKFSNLYLRYYQVDSLGATSTAAANLTTPHLGGSLAGIAAALPVTVTANFSERLDPAIAWSNPTTLANVFSFTDSNGMAVAPVSVTLTTLNQSIEVFIPGGLQPNTRYDFRVKGGLAGVRSSDENSLTLMRHHYFSGRALNNAQASDDSPNLYLYTTAGTFTPATSNQPPQVNAVTYNTANRCWKIEFNTFSGNGKMDPASLNDSTVQLITCGSPNTYTSTDDFELDEKFGSVRPSTMYYDLAGNALYVYVPEQFPLEYADIKWMRFKVMITSQVRSNDGLLLDGTNPPDGVSTGDYTEDVFTGVGGLNGAGGTNSVPITSH